MALEIPGVVVRPLEIHTDRRGWLVELFRQDELPERNWPVMSYLSITHPGEVRGPHEHRIQDDCFAFAGPSTFRLYLWDNRPDSTSFGAKVTLEVGQKNPSMVIIPAGVVHAYKNIGDVDGHVYNAPNRLFAGHGKGEEIDTIRHEDQPDSKFKLDP